MPTQPAKQFDPSAQAEQRITEVEIKLHEIVSLFGSVRFLFDHMRRDIERLRDERDDFGLFTEEEAAAKLQITRDQLRQLRYRHKFEYVNLGKIRYTADQIKHIAEFLTVNRKQRTTLRMKNAA